MRLRQVLIGLLTLILLLGTGAKQGHKLVDRWFDPEFERQKFKKLLVIAITDDLQARKNFENRFVSHLRGKYIEAVTSYSLVTDLVTLDGKSKEDVLAAIDELKIDGAISVRTVSLRGLSEKDWGQAWASEVRPLRSTDSSAAATISAQTGWSFSEPNNHTSQPRSRML